VDYELQSQGQAGATPGIDVIMQSGSAVLFDGVASTTILASIIDDTIPEAAEAFVVVITGVSLLFADESAAVDSPRVDDSAGSVTLTIAANDNASGVFGFATAVTRVDETPPANGSDAVEVIVQRAAGSFGTVTVLWELASAQATAGVDFVVPAGRLLTFAPGVTEQAIRFLIVDDNSPEPTESIALTLLSVEGGLADSAPRLAPVARLGSRIDIRANDDIRGLYGFLVDSRLEEVAEGAFVMLAVRRTHGLLDDVTVTWLIRPVGAVIGAVEDDFNAVAGSLFFPGSDDDGRVQTIDIQVRRTVGRLYLRC